MAGSELLHRLYTNASAGPGEPGGARTITVTPRDASAFLSEDVLAALDDLLRKTQAEEDDTAWVARRFIAADGGSYTCLLASYPDLFVDAKGRPGFLSHARLVRGAEPSADLSTLVDAAHRFAIADIDAKGDDQRLATYLELVRVDVEAPVTPLSIASLQRMPKKVLAELLAAFLSGLGQNARTRVGVPAALEDLAKAWGALPPAVQRFSSWALNAAGNTPVDVIFAARGKSPAQIASAALIECVRNYVGLLHEAPEQFEEIVRNPRVTNVVKLDEAVRRATVGVPLAARASPSEDSQEAEMQTTRRARSPKSEVSRDDWEPLDADTVAELKRQQDALVQSARDYIDKRLATAESRQSSQTSPLGRMWVPAIAVLSLLLSGVALYVAWRKAPDGRARRAQVAAAAGAPVAVHSEPERDPPALPSNPAAVAVAAASSSGRWADTLRDLLASDPEFASRAISSAGSTALDGFATRVANGTDLEPEGREQLRALLLDAIAAQTDSGERVDGKLAAAKVARLRREYGVRATKTQDVQSEIILRWMAGHAR